MNILRQSLSSIATTTGINYSSVRTLAQQHREGNGRVNRLLNFMSKKSLLKAMTRVRNGTIQCTKTIGKANNLHSLFKRKIRKTTKCNVSPLFLNITRPDSAMPSDSDEQSPSISLLNR